MLFVCFFVCPFIRAPTFRAGTHFMTKTCMSFLKNAEYVLCAGFHWTVNYLCRYIDTNQDVYVDHLSEAVAIRSVSGWPEVRGEVTRMVQYVAKVGF